MCALHATVPEQHAGQTADSASTPSLAQLLTDDMKAVDAVIEQRLSSNVALVSQVAQYIIHAGGKRLRPALLLLTSGALADPNTENTEVNPAAQHRHILAAVVEFIHTATLLHDDVVDDSTLRRGRATANQHFGNPASVLVGDFLYSRAFEMMVETGSMRVMQILAEATNIIAEGEVLQLMHVHNAQLDQATYIEVIRSKTAKLFEASARLGAVITDCDTAVETACAEYGQAIGTAFQIVDDMLDYQGSSDSLGKNLGDDLREGKVTLPLILAMQKADAADAQLIRDCIEAPEAHSDAFARIMSIIQQADALSDTLTVAKQQAELAIDAITVLPDTIYTQQMRQLANELLTRAQ